MSRCWLSSTAGAIPVLAIQGTNSKYPSNQALEQTRESVRRHRGQVVPDQLNFSFGEGKRPNDMANPLDEEARRLVASIPHGPRLTVLGSTSFWGPDSRTLCEMIAGELAIIDRLIAITGGMDGVGITFGKAFAAARTRSALPENLIHLLPRGLGPCDCGVTLGAGIDYRERREILGRVGNVCLVIEGGPGTEHEVSVALSRGIPVIPLGRTGGNAGDIASQMARPKWAAATDWALLGDENAPQSEVVLGVGRLVRAALGIDVEQRGAPEPPTTPTVEP